MFQSNQDLILGSNNLDEIKPVRDHSSQIFQIESDINFLNRVIRDLSIMVQDNDEILGKLKNIKIVFFFFKWVYFKRKNSS